ncbi:MAG: DUF2000 domain-containing protein [Thermomicrobiales bacterium]|nr:DUF2000 domain-containing protein [Thermomicrobiales bacterium]MCO5228799.1 DUF2000 domain-containing protein [Thermomicrobiales bacterium]
MISNDQNEIIPPEPVRFDTKVVVLLREGLLPWQELNVTAFLMAGIATSEESLTGAPYRDKDSNEYLPLLRQPVVVMSADLELMQKARSKALSRNIPVAIYIRAMFSTGDDVSNRATVEMVAADDLDLVGIAMRGTRNTVDRIVKGARMHE